MQCPRPTPKDKADIERHHEYNFSVNDIAERMDLAPYQVKLHLLSIGAVIKDEVAFSSDNPVYNLKFNQYYNINEIDPELLDVHFPMFKILFDDDYKRFMKVKR